VWNLGSEKQLEPEFTIPTKGPVQCIEAANGTVLYSADEPAKDEAPDVPIGMVNVLNQANMTTIPIQVP
jgi:hypothetical protein